MLNIKTIILAFIHCIVIVHAVFADSADKPKWLFSCAPDNDLYRVMLKNTMDCERFSTAQEAVARANENAAVLILADGYPLTKTTIDESVWKTASDKHLKLYVEYPSSIPQMDIGDIQFTEWERGVVASNAFGNSLPPMSILAIHDCHYVKVHANNPLMVIARVAGFNNAVFGLPGNSQPILFQHPANGAWIATTKFSQFVTARYAPYAAWQTVWKTILSGLLQREVPMLAWKQSVRPTYAKQEELPPEAESKALREGIEWFYDSHLLLHSDEEPLIDLQLKQGYVDPAHQKAGWISKGARVFPEEARMGDGHHGFLEGFSSRILSNGNQMQSISRRSDCMSEAAMGFAFSSGLPMNPDYKSYAANVLDYVYFDSKAQQGVRANPAHPAYGLIAWGVTNWTWERATYGDDMARVMLATLASSGLLQSDRWDEGVLKCLLGSLRTTGILGFRHNRIDIPDLETNGWRHYFNEPSISYAPHYQAYLWACYLWAYQQTGYELFLTRAKSAIRMTMEAYPDDWHWTNGLQQERARMLLPLAWLVRIEDTAEHRGWLRSMAEELLAFQDESGALREEIGAASQGSYGPPKSNEAYGTGETPLLQTNGDPVCDLLYTTNFAFLGLHEAAAATGDPFYQRAGDRLAEFLCRIQIQSDAHPELDGGWFRAFDFNDWEYWASSADAGWGAWSIESGWTQGWIVAVLGLRQRKTSLWELTLNSKIEQHFDELHPLFFPGGDRPAPIRTISHAASGTSIQFNTEYSSSYPALGKNSLIDGFLADDTFPDAMWQGYHGNDIDALIDLGKTISIAEIQMRFLQHIQSGIFLPSAVTFSLSADGKSFHALPAITHDVSQKKPGTIVHVFDAKTDRQFARFIKVTAKSIHTIPEWHHAKGEPAWLFTDEIIVNPTKK